jgi:cellobiose phosphorylase
VAAYRKTGGKGEQIGMAIFGYFNEDGTEYIIDKPLMPKRHMVNFSWNSTVISGVNQFGTGEGVFNNQTFLYNAQSGRARMIRDGRRYFYLRDDDTGIYWNAGYYPVKHEPAVLKTVFGAGYSRFVHETEGIKTDSLCFIADDEAVEIWKISVENTADSERKLRIYPYVEWLLQGYPIGSDYYSYLKSEYYGDINTIVGYNLSDERPHERYNGFVASSMKTAGYTGSVREFMGAYGEATRPRAVTEGISSNSPTCNENLAGALEIPVVLKAKECKDLIILIGNTSDINETRRTVSKLLNADTVEKSYKALLSSKRKMIESTVIETPNKKIDRLINVWAKNQVTLCSEFGRDGVRGFRDTLQDAWAVVSFNPELAREKIAESLLHQKRDGSTLRGWMPVVTKHYSDGPTWIAPAVTEYIKYTGDRDFLDIEVPYYDEGKATVLEHMLTSLRHLYGDRGANGLCLAHHGDWNDSLDWMGKNGRGESVMTTMAFYRSLKLFEEMALELLEDKGLADEMGKMAEEIRAAVEEKAWDGEWYIQGYSDAGKKVGSRENTEGRLFLVPQAWAAYSGIAAGERLEKAMAAVEKYLGSKTGCVMCYPPFTKRDENVGRLTVILPGMYENASTYCHGSAFMIAAYLLSGKADKAIKLYEQVIPDSEQNPSDLSGVEPYAFTNQYLGPDNLRAGVSVSGWITGTAGWMYKNLVNYFLGFQPGYTGVKFKPCIPGSWNKAAYKTILRDTGYTVEIRKGGEADKGLYLHTKRLDGNFLPYGKEKEVHITVKV